MTDYREREHIVLRWATEADSPQSPRNVFVNCEGVLIYRDDADEEDRLFTLETRPVSVIVWRDVATDPPTKDGLILVAKEGLICYQFWFSLRWSSLKRYTSWAEVPQIPEVK